MRITSNSFKTQQGAYQISMSRKNCSKCTCACSMNCSCNNNPSTVSSHSHVFKLFILLRYSYSSFSVTVRQQIIGLHLVKWTNWPRQLHFQLSPFTYDYGQPEQPIDYKDKVIFCSDHSIISISISIYKTFSLNLLSTSRWTMSCNNYRLHN